MRSIFHIDNPTPSALRRLWCHMPMVGAAVAGAIFSAMAAAGVSAAVAGVVAGIAGIIAVIGVSLLPTLIMGGLNKLFGPKQFDPGRAVNIRQANQPRRVIYGRARVGGVITFVHISPRGDSPNNDLHILYTLAGHPLHSIDNILINGKIVSFGAKDSDGPFYQKLFFITIGDKTEGYYPAIDTYYKNLWMQKNLGKLSDDGFSGLRYATQLDGSNLWTTDHRQDGCGAVELLYTWNTNIYPNGVPTTLFDVHGREVLDFRTGTVGYSENPALAIYDYLTNSEWGLGATTDEIDIPSFIAAANACEESVSLKAGGSEDRYRINGTFNLDADPEAILTAMAASMAGLVIYSEGRWMAIAGVWGSPSLELGTGELVAPIKVTTLRSKTELCNGIRGTMYAPSRNWNKVDFPPVYHPEHVCDDSGFPNAVQKGPWATATDYVVGDAVTDITSRSLKGAWLTGTSYAVNDYVANDGGIYICTAAHTSGSTTEPGTGASWTSYWVDDSDGYAAAIGAIYVCNTAHTSAVLTRPGRGANWRTVWREVEGLIWKDLELPFTISPATAQRIAKIQLERVRRQVQIVCQFSLKAYPLQAGDLFYFTHGRFGWDSKIFQVMQTTLSIRQDGENQTLGVDIVAVEADAAIYAWDPGAEEQALGTPAQPTLPDAEIPGRDFYVYGPGMTYSSNGTSITWSWDYSGGNAIILLDNQNTTFEPQGSQAVTDLASSHTYWWYPFYDRLLSDISFAILATAGVGTPPWAQETTSDANTKRARIAEWQRDGHLALSLNPIVAATTAPGGGGGGGGGGDGGCLRLGMLVKEKTRGIIACEDVRIGDELWGPSSWLEVMTTRVASHDLWAQIEFNNGAKVEVTTMHPFQLFEGGIRFASALCLEDRIPSPTGFAYPVSIVHRREESWKVSLKLKEPHTFYASSDGEHWILTHNTQVILT